MFVARKTNNATSIVTSIDGSSLQTASASRLLFRRNALFATHLAFARHSRSSKYPATRCVWRVQNINARRGGALSALISSDRASCCHRSASNVDGFAPARAALRGRGITMTWRARRASFLSSFLCSFHDSWLTTSLQRALTHVKTPTFHKAPRSALSLLPLHIHSRCRVTTAMLAVPPLALLLTLFTSLFHWYTLAFRFAYLFSCALLLRLRQQA